MADKSARRSFPRRIGSRRIWGVRPSLEAGFIAFTWVRLVAATPPDDTPIARAGTAQAPAEQRLVDWAAKHRAKLSFTVASLADGKRLMQHDGAVLRNPASVSKLVTAYVALKVLGPSFQYKTTLHGRLVAGHIPRLVVRGHGDPTLSSDQVQGMAARLSAMGLQAIDEALTVDQSYFDDSFVPPAFEQQPNEWAAFRAPVCALAMDKNRLVLRILPGKVGENAQVFVEPLGAVELAGQIRSIERDTRGRSIHWSISPGTERSVVRVSGEIGANESALALERRAVDPRKIVGHALRQALIDRGVKVPEGVGLGTVEGLPLLFAHQSDALALHLYRLGKESDNFAAEMLLKSIGARLTAVGSSESGARALSEWLLRLGPTGAEARFVNGSGLFDANRASTNLLVRLLAEAAADKSIAPEYLAQLSIAGSDGTLSKRLRKLPAGCVVRAKTGTLRSTISLAGLVDRPDGGNLAFAIVVEDVKDQSSTRTEVDRFVEALCLSPLVKP